jgi:hypothetical protein
MINIMAAPKSVLIIAAIRPMRDPADRHRFVEDEVPFPWNNRFRSASSQNFLFGVIQNWIPMVGLSSVWIDKQETVIAHQAKAFDESQGTGLS